MKTQTKIIFLLVIVIAVGIFAAVVVKAEESQTDDTDTTDTIVHGPGLVDLDGDGYNDNAPDHDGDGIPNGQDPDWVQGAGNRRGALNHNGWGRGYGKGAGRGMTGQGNGVRGFVDENGDGFNDLAPDHDGDGIPNGQDPDFVEGAGQGRFAGHGPGFSDKDGDGTCDRRQNDDSDGDEDGNGNRGGGKDR